MKKVHKRSKRNSIVPIPENEGGKGVDGKKRSSLNSEKAYYNQSFSHADDTINPSNHIQFDSAENTLLKGITPVRTRKNS